MTLKMDIFLDPRPAVRRALDDSVAMNVGDVLAMVDPATFALKLQVVRVHDAERMTLILPSSLFSGARSFEEVIRRDPTALAKLILFLA